MSSRGSTRRSAGLAAAWFALAALLVACGSDVAAGRYRCPMHPTVVSDRPGDCSVCGMSLVSQDAAREEGTLAALPANRAATAPVDRSTVALTPDAVRMAGILTEEAAAGSLTRTVRASGVVRSDPNRVSHIVPRISGWIEKLHVKATGTSVSEGQPLFNLYAPDTVALQQEYIRYLKSLDPTGRLAGLPEGKRRSEDLFDNARQRMERYDFPPTLIEDLQQNGTPRTQITYTAPGSGFVQIGAVFEGQQIEPGMEIMSVTDLSEVWVEADLFEQDIPRVQPDQNAAISLLHDSRLRKTCRLLKTNPFLDETSRTMKTWFGCPNGDLSLKPGMFTIVEMPFESGEGVIVSSSAVLDTGRRRVVFVETGADRFEPREIRVGLRAGERTQILSGIAPGERVVVRGNFLLDAESRLRRSVAEANGGEGPR